MAMLPKKDNASDQVVSFFEAAHRDDSLFSFSRLTSLHKEKA